MLCNEILTHTHMKHTYIVLLIIKSASDFGCCLQLGFLVLSSLQSLLFKDRCFFFCLDHYFMVLIILACPLHLNLNLASPKTFFLNFMTSLSDVIPCCYPSRNMTTYMTEMYMQIYEPGKILYLSVVTIFFQLKNDTYKQCFNNISYFHTCISIRILLIFCARLLLQNYHLF